MRLATPARRLLVALATPLVLASALTGAGPAAAASAAAACRPVTGAQPPAPAGATHSELDSVTVLSPCNAWAVGSTHDRADDEDHGLIEHWDGSTWTQVPSPEPIGAVGSDLLSVRAVSPTLLWAVGQWDDGKTDHILILRGDGHTWTGVDGPDLADTFSTLNGVRPVSASDIWAVGELRTASHNDGDQTLVLHWNGTSWTRVPSPSPGAADANNDLAGVAATARNDAWAVGTFVAGGSDQPLVLHWNGTRWSRVTSPSFKAAELLSAVGASSRSNAWIVGRTSSLADGKTLTLHWNGTSWKLIPSPNEVGIIPANTLSGVAVASATSAWVVGAYEGGGTALIMHWDGRKWTHLPDPLPRSQFVSFLAGVATGPGGSAWAVGGVRGGTGPTIPLALHCC